MKKLFLLFLSAGIISSALHAQLMVAKVIGKNAGHLKMGYGLFMYYDIPVNGFGNKSVRIELMDLAYFPSKDDSQYDAAGYISVKLGYKQIFSDTKTGFYVEPQLGYCRVVLANSYGSDYGDGVAAAAEAGYNLEVGERGHTFTFGLKYERDMAGREHTLSSIGFRVSYSFGILRRRDD